MIKKTALLLLWPVLIQICYSCTSCFMDGSDPKPFYDVKGYTSKNSRITYKNGSDLEFESLPESKSVEFDKLIIYLSASVDFHSMTKPVLPFYNSAFACDPEPNGYKGTKEMLDSLSVTSSFDFHDSHPKGTSLNEFFDIHTFYSSKGSATLNQYLNQDSPQAPREFGLLLNTKPTISSLQQFIITFYLSTGEEFSVKSIPVELL